MTYTSLILNLFIGICVLAILSKAISKLYLTIKESNQVITIFGVFPSRRSFHIDCVNGECDRQYAQNEAYKTPVIHALSFSLERSGAKYNESPTKTRTNSMTAYVYQLPNEDGKIFVTATFTDDSGVIIRFENMLIPHSDSKSETTKLSIEEAKRLARLVIEGHFDSDQTL